MEALEMETEMDSWNDDRLDELNGRVKDGFEKVDERFVRVEGEVKDGFVYLDQRTTAGFERINDRIDRIYYAVIVAAVSLIGTLLANGIWG